jgi:DNA-binding beta-propeller fold protein YncE
VYVAGNGQAANFHGQYPWAPNFGNDSQTASGTSGTVNFSTDARQSCLYVADLTNDTIYVINRQNLTELTRFATGGRQAGLLHWPHVVSVDSEGNVYTGEVDGAGRVQKFLR